MENVGNEQMKTSVDNAQNGTYQNFDLSDISSKSTLSYNVNQICFVSTHDKVVIALRDYEDNKKLASNWWNFLTMFISFLIPTITSTFGDIWNITGSGVLLKAIFLLCSIGTGLLTAVSIIRRIKNRKIITIEYCANLIQNEGYKLKNKNVEKK